MGWLALPHSKMEGRGEVSLPLPTALSRQVNESIYPSPFLSLSFALPPSLSFLSLALALALSLSLFFPRLQDPPLSNRPKIQSGGIFSRLLHTLRQYQRMTTMRNVTRMRNYTQFQGIHEAVVVDTDARWHLNSQPSYYTGVAQHQAFSH